MATERETEYPECKKLSATHKERLIVGDFIEWLFNEKGFDLCTFETECTQENASGEEETLELKTVRVRYRGFDDEDDGAYLLVNKTRDTLLAEHFNIDMKKVEVERRAMLDEQRKRNEEDGS